MNLAAQGQPEAVDAMLDAQEQNSRAPTSCLDDPGKDDRFMSLAFEASSPNGIEPLPAVTRGGLLLE
jgi:hypothetical protein